jgi:hypothetical protein
VETKGVDKVAQVARDFLLLAKPTAIPPGPAVLVIRVDGSSWDDMRKSRSAKNHNLPRAASETQERPVWFAAEVG